MSVEKFLVTGASGETGRYTVRRLLEKGHAVRALVHKDDERSEALRGNDDYLIRSCAPEVGVDKFVATAAGGSTIGAFHLSACSFTHS